MGDDVLDSGAAERSDFHPSAVDHGWMDWQSEQKARNAREQACRLCLTRKEEVQQVILHDRYIRDGIFTGYRPNNSFNLQEMEGKKRMTHEILVETVSFMKV